MSRGQNPVIDIEEVAITDGEVETVESLVLQLSENLTGRAPKESEWEPMRPYCSRKEEKKTGFAEQNIEFFRWALMWIQKTRTYLEFLDGLQPADHAAETLEQVEPATISAQGNTDSRVDEGVDRSDKTTGGVGRYIGKIVWTPLPDGRLMELIENFGFIDPLGLEWPVPSGTRVDGASIPQPLWSIVGSPFTGQYRDASVVHDYYCDTRIRHWAAVHRVFYDAMIVSGVGLARAKIMYAAVYFGGPRWSTTVSYNNKLQRPSLPEDVQFSVQHSPFELDVMKAIEVNGTTVDAFLRSGEWMPPSGDETRLHIGHLERLISEYDPSPEQIAAALDTSTNVMDAVIPKNRILIAK